MKKVKLYLFVAVLIVGFMSGCTKNFKEINTNPNAPTTLEPGLLIADIVISAQNEINSTFDGGDMGASWSQQWSKVQYNDEERYQPRTSIIERGWNRIYEDVISDAHTMEVLAEKEKNNNTKAVALILQAWGYQYLTDMYGAIPFSQAIKAESGVFKPKYDTQENVYKGIVAMLDSANLLLTADGGTINNGSDLIYGGDWTKWQKFANSLEFRVLMRESSKVDVAAKLQEVAGRSLFTSSADEAKLPYLDAYPNANPIYESIVYNVREEYKVNQTMVDFLDGNHDPRLAVYAQKNDAGKYRGKPAGIAGVPTDDWNYKNVSAIGKLYLEPTLPGYFMSYTELEFLMAEAREKGLITTGTAATYYQNGLAASMAFNGISDWTGMTDATLSSDKNTALQQIAEQNWVALYGQGMEAWTEWRRTGYPVLTPAIDGYQKTIPTRLYYPPTEASLNAANYAAAVAAQGADNLSTKIWWETK